MLLSLIYNGFTPEEDEQALKISTGSFDDNRHLSIQAISGDKSKKLPKSLAIDDNRTVTSKNSGIQTNKVIS